MSQDYRNRVFYRSCETMAEIPDGVVQTCVTSPPYFGLRDYGTASWEGGEADCEHIASERHYTEKSAAKSSAEAFSEAGESNAERLKKARWREPGSCTKCGAVLVDKQIGLEPTVAEYVERLVRVFREVRRVLRDDGTLWLNLGDSYAGSWGAGILSTRSIGAHPARQERTGSKKGDNLKPKDLIGIPWLVAFALRAPFYTGRIKSETDKAWLAAMIDGEGSLFIQKRHAGREAYGGYLRKTDTFSPGLSVCNTDRLIVERCQQITGIGSIMERNRGKAHWQNTFDWRIMANQARDIVREVYPYLVAKRQQARILIGSESSGPKAAEAHEALKALHHASSVTVDYREPKNADLWEPGWYLRSDVVWSKTACMPESIEDRPTRAHEFIFLLSKAARYFYDADAIRDPLAESSLERLGQNVEAQVGSDRIPGKTNGTMKAVRFGGNKAAGVKSATYSGNEYTPEQAQSLIDRSGANKRDVWRIAPAQYSEAHLATFPPEIPSLCIRAGSKPGDLILDPFAGSGTTLEVAEGLGRSWCGYELNKGYRPLIEARLRQRGLFAAGLG